LLAAITAILAIRAVAQTAAAGMESAMPANLTIKRNLH
jgi:hypothetical protein